MTQARLIVSLPDEPWVSEVSRNHPTAIFRVLAVLPGEDAGYALVGIDAPSVDPILAEMRSHPTVSELSVLAQSDDEVTVQFETSTPLLVRAAEQAGVPLQMPIEITDGEATLTVYGSDDGLPALAERLEAHGFDYRIEQVGEGLGSGPELTNRQLETVSLAVECGYYDTPRQCSLTELSDALGLAKSTVSETLHRAEGAVVKSFLADEE